MHMLLLVAILLLSALALVAGGSNEAGLAFLAENRENPDVIELPSGLQYKVLKKGRGTAYPTANSPCSCHYEGSLIDGTVFDSSYKRGEPTTFAPNQVIKGWTEAMQMMVVGDKWEMYIPSELGYGDRGSPPKIGPGDTLVFQMEILAIQGDSIPALQCTVSGDGDNDETKEKCNEREQSYIAKVVTKWKGNDSGNNKIAKEIERLRSILAGPMKDDLRDWARRRVHILVQFLDHQAAAAAAEQEL